MIYRNGEILLAVRGKNPSQGKWGLPGGVVEVGETLEEALVREILEETGVIVTPVEFLQVFNFINRDDEGVVSRHYILFEFLCEYVSGAVCPGDDAPDAKWVSVKDLSSVDIMPFTFRFIRETLGKRGLV